MTILVALHHNYDPESSIACTSAWKFLDIYNTAILYNSLMIPLVKNNYSHKTVNFYALNSISTKKQSAFLTSSQDNPY